MSRRVPAALAFAALAACHGGDITGPSVLRDVEWRLVSLQPAGAAAVPVDRPDLYSLRLGANGQALMFADCNGCDGRYTLAGPALQVSGIFCTARYCGDASLDRQYLHLLDGASLVAAGGDRLTISSPRGTLTFSR